MASSKVQCTQFLEMARPHLSQKPKAKLNADLLALNSLPTLTKASPNVISARERSSIDNERETEKISVDKEEISLMDTWKMKKATQQTLGVYACGEKGPYG